MKQALVSRGPSIQVVDSEIPKPTVGQVLIQVKVSGSNPKDWKLSEYDTFQGFNTGDDIAGIITAVGAGVLEFKPGNRVAAMHQIATAHGSFAEYAIAPADTTFHIPTHVSFEEAATIPLAAMTAAGLLFRILELPEPQLANKDVKAQRTPFIVYGASSAVGAFAIQLAKHRGIGPVIAVAGRGASFVETLLDRDQGDTIVDYRQRDQEIVADLRAGLLGAGRRYALDAVRSETSLANIAQALRYGSSDALSSDKVAVVRPLGNSSTDAAGDGSISLPAGVNPVYWGVDVVHSPESSRDRELGFVQSRLFGRGLKEGWLKPHPHVVRPGGLAGLESGLRELKDGKASATKYVYRIADTPGVAV